MSEQSATSHGKRREPWGRLAKRRGISSKTQDRWAAAGIVPKPEYINGRKYGDPDVEPRRDPEPREEGAVE
jgi:hypothetical protein